MPDAPPPDPADHAVAFAVEWADRFEEHSKRRMNELGVPIGQIGVSDLGRGMARRAFFPDEREGGSVSPGGRINLDSGLLNPDLMDGAGPRSAEAWAKARLRDRMDASIAHEYEEAKSGSHDQAVEDAPATELPIRPLARDLLRTIAEEERRKRARRATPRGDATPHP